MLRHESMPMYYTASFAAEARGETAVELSERITNFVLEKLEAAAPGDTLPDVSHGKARESYYAAITAERPTGREGIGVRLEVRVCTDGRDAAQIQVKTRFIASEIGQKRQPAPRPPNLLRDLLEGFAADPRNAIAPSQVAPDQAEGYIQRFVADRERRIPLVIVTQDTDGKTGINLERLQGYLTGIAQIAVFDQSGVQTPQRTFNGAMRILWPDDTWKYISPGDARRATPEDIMRQVLAQQKDDHFEARFSHAQAETIEELNRQPQPGSQDVRQDASAAGRDGTIEELRLELRKAQVESMMTRRQLNAAQERVKELELDSGDDGLDDGDTSERSVGVTAIAFNDDGSDDAGDGRGEMAELRRRLKEAREESQKREKTIERLNVENQGLRQIQADSDGPGNGAITIAIQEGPQGNVTLLNRGVHLYCQKMRGYIITRLKAAHGEGLAKTLSRHIPMDQLKTRIAELNPEALLDIGDYDSIVRGNPDLFQDNQLAQIMSEVRTYRNNAAHPPPKGIQKDSAVDALHTIARALAKIGAMEEQAMVESLIPLCR